MEESAVLFFGDGNIFYFLYANLHILAMTLLNIFFHADAVKIINCFKFCNNVKLTKACHANLICISFWHEFLLSRNG